MSTKYSWIQRVPNDFILRKSSHSWGGVWLGFYKPSWTWGVFSGEEELVSGLNYGKEATKEEAMRRVEEYLDLVDEY